jgi:hypothetical protein
VKPGETKISDISGSVQQHGSGRVEKDGILELNGEGSNSQAECTFTHDGSMHGCTNSITAKSTGLHADLMPNVDTHSEKHVVRRSAGEREPSDASTDISVNGNRRFEVGGKQRKYREFASNAPVCQYMSGNFSVDGIGCGSVQGKAAGREGKHANYTLVASSSTSTSQMSESANTLAVSALRSNSSGTSQPMVFRYSASTPAQRWNSRSGGNRRVAASDVFDQHRLFLAKEIMFAPQASVSQYTPRNSGGNGIMSVAPGTKPGPRWCPIGLSHTQKRRVQRLRALEIKEEITEKELEEWFHRGRPMVPLKMIWKKKHIMVDKNRNADDIVADRISDNFRDAATQMDVHQGG